MFILNMFYKCTSDLEHFAFTVKSHQHWRMGEVSFGTHRHKTMSLNNADWVKHFNSLTVLIYSGQV
jgi:hypothetical protein